ncbi:hypothetical protein [Caulobacter sp.]|uniref:hypothetical protein n=1 Tax=Caulobacter sp. TaxID=78 RepID=UPI002B4894D6|nr:hypothetical protein [Caulobacter sp.]HJV40341.1 hypothetical protein [Caulobacter sp.]
MARRAWSRRWLAASGGVLINGLILGALILVEEPPPRPEEAPVTFLDVERPERERAPPARSGAARVGGAPAVRGGPVGAASAESSPQAPAEFALPTSEPAWRVDERAVDRWRLLEGNAALGIGRFKRACSGLSSEHMTPDEKERCYGGWNDRKDRRPSPDFIGPIDERRWEIPQANAPSRFDKDARRQQRCRDYRRGRTPGFSERNLDSIGAPPPSLRDGGCF